MSDNCSFWFPCSLTASRAIHDDSPVRCRLSHTFVSSMLAVAVIACLHKRDKWHSVWSQFEDDFFCWSSKIIHCLIACVFASELSIIINMTNRLPNSKHLSNQTLCIIIMMVARIYIQKPFYRNGVYLPLLPTFSSVGWITINAHQHRFQLTGQLLFNSIHPFTPNTIYTLELLWQRTGFNQILHCKHTRFYYTLDFSRFGRNE